MVSLPQDHPSLGQLADKLLENNIYSIFAVDKHYQWYEVIHTFGWNLNFLNTISINMCDY